MPSGAQQGAGYRRWLALILGLGLGLRLLLSAFYPVSFDMSNFARAVDLLGREALDFYGVANRGDTALFPYPPAYLVWVVTVDGLGTGFRFGVRLAPIVADIALAWLVQRHLMRTGAAPAVALAAAGLVALGPQVILTAAAEGQLDSVAILPGVIAVALWQRGDANRAVTAGLLLGLATSIKTVPLVLVAALIPTARSRREALLLSAVAIAVPAAMLAPFFAADPRAVTKMLGYSGGAGSGGLNVLAQPGLADFSEEPLTQTSRFLQDWNTVLVLLVSALLAFVLWKRRVDPIRAAAILWLGVFVFGVNWYPQYLNWGLPFFLMAGWIMWVAALQAVLLPFAVGYLGGYMGPLAGDYASVRPGTLVASSAAAWLMWVERLWRAISPRTTRTGRA